MMSSLSSGTSKAEVLKDTQSKDRMTSNHKAFPHEKASEWLKDHMKWELVKKTGEESPPLLQNEPKHFHRTHTTTSSDAQYPPRFPLSPTTVV